MSSCCCYLEPFFFNYFFNWRSVLAINRSVSLEVFKGEKSWLVFNPQECFSFKLSAASWSNLRQSMTRTRRYGGLCRTSWWFHVLVAFKFQFQAGKYCSSITANVSDEVDSGSYWFTSTTQMHIILKVKGYQTVFFKKKRKNIDTLKQFIQWTSVFWTVLSSCSDILSLSQWIKKINVSLSANEHGAV